MNPLYLKKCSTCTKNTSIATPQEKLTWSSQLDSCWQLKSNYLTRKFEFKNFKESLAFVNKIGQLAQQHQHHPDILISWAIVELKLHTYSVQNLTENDFILAACIDRVSV
jgi:4a-hydroxytetrahydrobiopterin dehydratase